MLIHLKCRSSAGMSAATSATSVPDVSGSLQVGSKGFRAVIPRGSYCSRIGLLPDEELKIQTGNFPFFLTFLSSLFLSFLFSHFSLLDQRYIVQA